LKRQPSDTVHAILEVEHQTLRRSCQITVPPFIESVPGPVDDSETQNPIPTDIVMKNLFFDYSNISCPRRRSMSQTIQYPPILDRTKYALHIEMRPAGNGAWWGGNILFAYPDTWYPSDHGDRLPAQKASTWHLFQTNGCDYDIKVTFNTGETLQTTKTMCRAAKDFASTLVPTDSPSPMSADWVRDNGEKTFLIVNGVFDRSRPEYRVWGVPLVVFSDEVRTWTEIKAEFSGAEDDGYKIWCED
jgi:hypothetical protein